MPKSKSNDKVPTKRAAGAKHTVKDKADARITGATLTVLNTSAALQADKSSVPRKLVTSMLPKLGKSTIANAFTKLKNNSLMIVTPDTITVTPKGMDLADVDKIDIPNTDAKLQEQVKETFKLKGNEIKLMDLLTDGEKHEKTTVKEENLRINGTSTFANLLTRMKKYEIIEFDRTHVWLTSKMFIKTRYE